MVSPPKVLKARRVQGAPREAIGQLEPIMGTGIDEAATDTGLALEWPRESDASVKEAQVGQPGGVASRKERWRS